MRKWILTALIGLAVLTAAIYIFIPSHLEISKVAVLNCTLTGTYRNLSDENKWTNWGLTKDKNSLSPQSDSTLKYGSVYYTIVEKLRNELVVQMESGHLKINSRITLIERGNDSSIVLWKCTMPSGWSPFSRIRCYREAVHFSDNMRNILQQLRSFLENQTNVYGITIIPSSITDTCLLAKKYVSPDYPTTHDIYDVVSNLKNFAVEHGTFMNGKPMMNVEKLNRYSFQTMIAIPVNRDLSVTGDIFSRRMVPGRFMITDVTGGIYTVNKAIEQLQLYFADYQKTSMAIPFQSLITDRNLEPDTSKWLTRLYAPVLQ